MSYASGIGSLQQAINSTARQAAIQANLPDGIAKSGEGSVVDVRHADQANLSSTGGLVAQALESSDARLAKVASLQQAIASGNYSVSSSDVADKIIQSLLD